MKYVERTIRGLMYVALAGAFALGFGFVMSLIFSDDSSAPVRIITFGLAAGTFLVGFLAEGGGESGAKDEETGE